MHSFLGRDMYGQQRFDPHGLLAWAKERFSGGLGGIIDDQDFILAPKDKLHQVLLQASKKYYPTDGIARIEAELDKHFENGGALDDNAAGELARWAKEALKLSVEAGDLAGQKEDAVREILNNAFDDLYRPEMRAMERSLVLNIVDSSWKDHLYTMDYLRSAVGFVGYAQQDPKTTYKRDGMKAFEEMWEGDPTAEYQEKESIQDKVTDYIFRMEEAVEDTSAAMLASAQARHDTSTGTLPAPKEGDIRAQQDAAIAGSQTGGAKPEPVRNKGPRVGRNDPCTCGSGKKYKNCCMKKEAG